MPHGSELSSPNDDTLRTYLEWKQDNNTFNKALYGRGFRDQEPVLLIGPSGVGKSTHADYLVKHRPKQFGYIGTTTNRDHRPGDPKEYRTARDGITLETFRDAANEGRIVNFRMFANGFAYGTFPEDFHGKYPIGPFVNENIDDVIAAGFRNVHPIFLIARRAVFASRLINHRLHFPDIEARLDDAESGIEFADQFADNPDYLTFAEISDGKKALKASTAEIARLAMQNARTEMSAKTIHEILDDMRFAVDDARAELKRNRVQ